MFRLLLCHLQALQDTDPSNKVTCICILVSINIGIGLHVSTPTESSSGSPRYRSKQQGYLDLYLSIH